jgi:DNA repair protein RecO (recombination protein O)
MIQSTEAVVLHAMKYGETSKIVTVYSREFGKIKVMAKGARSSKNKFGASLEPMTYSSLIIYKKEHRDLHLLSKCEIINPHFRLMSNGDKIGVGLSLVELLNMVMHNEDKHENVFQLLVQSLALLDAAERNYINLFAAFTMHLLRFLGYTLTLDHCAGCGAAPDVQTSTMLSIRLSSGAWFCSNCSPANHPDVFRLSVGAARSLIYCTRTEDASLFQLELNCGVKEEVIRLLQTYLQSHIESVRTLRSLLLLS